MIERENYCRRIYKGKYTGDWQVEIWSDSADVTGTDSSKTNTQICFTNLTNNQKILFNHTALPHTPPIQKSDIAVKGTKDTDQYGNDYLKFEVAIQGGKAWEFYIDPALPSDSVVDCADQCYAVGKHTQNYKNFKLYCDPEKGTVSYNKTTGKLTTILDEEETKKYPFYVERYQSRVFGGVTPYNIINEHEDSFIKNGYDGFIFGISECSPNTPFIKDSDLRICICDAKSNKLTFIRHTNSDEIIKKEFITDHFSTMPGYSWNHPFVEVHKTENGKRLFSFVNEETFDLYPLFEADSKEEAIHIIEEEFFKNECIQVLRPYKAMSKLSPPADIAETNTVAIHIRKIDENEKMCSYKVITPSVAFNCHNKCFSLPKGVYPIGIMPSELFWPKFEHLKDEFIILTADVEATELRPHYRLHFTAPKRIGYVSSDRALCKPTAYANTLKYGAFHEIAQTAVNRVAMKLARSATLSEWNDLKKALAQKAKEANKFEGLEEDTDADFLDGFGTNP